MNEYIFYTAEGHTDAPNDNYEIENCQVIGRAVGFTSDEAKKNLLKENDWIIEADFDPQEFFVKQVLTDEQRNDIKTLVDYLWTDEERYFEESEDKSNHIFSVIKRLNGI